MRRTSAGERGAAGEQEDAVHACHLLRRDYEKAGAKEAVELPPSTAA